MKDISRSRDKVKKKGRSRAGFFEDSVRTKKQENVGGKELMEDKDKN
jgi:hypothetical protein